MPVYLDPKIVRTFSCLHALSGPSYATFSERRSRSRSHLQSLQLPLAADDPCRRAQMKPALLMAESLPAPLNERIEHLMNVCRWICTTTAFAIVFCGSYFITSP